MWKKNLVLMMTMTVTTTMSECEIDEVLEAIATNVGGGQIALKPKMIDCQPHHYFENQNKKLAAATAAAAITTYIRIQIGFNSTNARLFTSAKKTNFYNDKHNTFRATTPYHTNKRIKIKIHCKEHITSCGCWRIHGMQIGKKMMALPSIGQRKLK